MAYLDLEVAGVIASGDHRVFLAKAVSGEVFPDEGEPMVHVRGSGFHY
jgi:flavin reductase (DIM6/NTAB) family NADH-FMN oxidoreductase RutF